MIITILGLLLLIAWLSLMVWSWFSPTPPPTADQERDRAIGAMIGSLGGDIESAVIARYTISRLEESLGRKATLHEIAVAIGASIAST
jgi:hypothetical protein